MRHSLVVVVNQILFDFLSVLRKRKTTTPSIEKSEITYYIHILILEGHAANFHTSVML